MQGGAHFIVLALALTCQGFFNNIFQLLTLLASAQQHAEAELSAIFKQAVAPGRALSLGIFAVRHSRNCRAPNGGAAGGIGYQHAVAIELGDQLGIRSFAAASAGAGEFQQRAAELAVLDIGRSNFQLRLLHGKIPVSSLVLLISKGIHGQGLFFGRADIDADAAALAIIRANLHSKLLAGKIFAVGIDRSKSIRLGSAIFNDYRTNGGMGANQRALVALDAVFLNPAGDKGRYAAFFKLRAARGEGAVLTAAKGRNRQLITAVGSHWPQHLADKGAFILGLVGIIGGSSPLSGNSYFAEAAHSGIDRLFIHINHFLTLASIGVFNALIKGVDRGIFRDNAGQLKESSLHNHIGMIAQA